MIEFYETRPEEHYHYNHNLPEAQVLISEHDSGLSWKNLAEKYSVSESTMWSRIYKYKHSGERKQNVKLSGEDSPVFRADLDLQKMNEDYKSGLTTTQIAEKYSCGKTTVKRKLKAAGVEMRVQIAKPKPAKEKKIKIVKEEISYPVEGIFTDINKYARIYRKIIENARYKNTDPNAYYEIHHAHPKALGGSNHPHNLVNLTPKEHYICHHLLTKCTFGDDKRKMVHAWHLMCVCDKTDKRYIPAIQYDYLRKELASVGKSEEHKAKLSEAAKNRKPRVFSEQAKKNMSEARKKEWSEGKYTNEHFKGPKSPEWRKKMSELRTINPWSTKKKEIDS